MKPIRIGTDCSGIEAPLQALKKLKIPYEQQWFCEIDKYARESIKANYKAPVTEFEDMTKKRKLPDIDLYVCGFSCQPFSSAGVRKGFDDHRGNLFFECLKVIKKKRPKYFLLENVKGLINHDGGNTYKIIQEHLNKLRNYDVYYKVLNTKDYGIPQNRERIFMVGVPKNQQFKFPKPVKSRKHIKDYVDRTVKAKKGEKPCPYAQESVKKSKGIFIEQTWANINSPLAFQEYCPTLTCGGNIWCKPMKRKVTIKELLSLQGFPKSFKQVVSDNQMKKQIANSMSVNVIAKLFKEMFRNDNSIS